MKDGLTMKNYLIALSLVILLSFAVAAQSGSSAAPSATTPGTATTVKTPEVQASNAVPLIGAGTGVVAELSNAVNAKKAKPGDRVKAQVLQDVLYRGKIVMRVGTKLIGHVETAKAMTKEDSESQLSVVFDKAELKGGGELSLAGSIRALAPSGHTSMVDQPEMMMPPSFPGPPGQGGPQPLGNPTSGSTGGRGVPVNQNTAVNSGSGAAATVAYSQVSSANSHYGPREGRLLSSASRGVIGLQGIMLTTSGSGATQKTVISSTRDNVKLESGIQIVVQLNVPVTQ
jgi:hypothetical protein